MGTDSSYFQYFSALGAATYLRVRHLKWRRLDATRSFEDLRVLKGLEELLSGASCKFKEPDPSLIGLVPDLFRTCCAWGRRIFAGFEPVADLNLQPFPIQPSLAWFCNSPDLCSPQLFFFGFMWIKYCISGTGLLNHWARLCSSLSSDLLTLTQCFILPK